jgi:hypothetical protein
VVVVVVEVAVEEALDVEVRRPWCSLQSGGIPASLCRSTNFEGGTARARRARRGTTRNRVAGDNVG